MGVGSGVVWFPGVWSGGESNEGSRAGVQPVKHAIARGKDGALEIDAEGAMGQLRIGRLGVSRVVLGGMPPSSSASFSSSCGLERATAAGVCDNFFARARRELLSRGLCSALGLA